jgi:hypothetical protein
MKPIYKPSQILRLVKAGTIADPQPRGEGKILCEKFRHSVGPGETESPTFWENGSYVYCRRCKCMMLARVEFKGFAIDLTGERKKYQLFGRFEQHAYVAKHKRRAAT